MKPKMYYNGGPRVEKPANFAETLRLELGRRNLSQTRAAMMIPPDDRGHQVSANTISRLCMDRNNKETIGFKLLRNIEPTFGLPISLPHLCIERTESGKWVTKNVQEKNGQTPPPSNKANATSKTNQLSLVSQAPAPPAPVVVEQVSATKKTDESLGDFIDLLDLVRSTITDSGDRELFARRLLR